MKNKCFIFCLLFTCIAHAQETKKTIAFAQDTMNNDFRKTQVLQARDSASQYPDISFIHSDAKGQTSLLIRHVNQYIQQQVDLIILGANDKEALAPSVTKAYQSGIPIIILDRGVNSRHYTTFINSDNYRIGTIAAEFISKKINNKGTVLLLEGIPTADVTQHRSQGFLDTIKAHKKIKIIRRTGNFLRKDALLEMEKLIDQGVHPDAIFSESDSMLSGVRMVLDKHNIAPSSIVSIGVDYIEEAKQAIMTGHQTATIRFPLAGNVAIETAIKILAKNSVPKHIVLPVQLITQSNTGDIDPIF